MGHQFILIGHSGEVEAGHFMRSQRWLSSSPQCDQHTRDDRTVRLDLDAVLILADQMSTPKDLLKEAEEDLNRLAF
jgi:hypothetical protein